MKAIQLVPKFKLYLVFIFLVITACNTNDYSEEEVGVTDVEIKENFSAVESPVQKYEADLRIIKSAKTRYKVDNVESSTEEIKLLAYNFGGYISDQRFENTSYKVENRFTIKVPNQAFYDLLSSIKKTVENVEFENITTQDVTEEYKDLQSRLRTKSEVKLRYEEILRKNAITVEDILATEDKLRIIQEEIEAAQGRLDYLSNKVAYSTIQIDLYEDVNIEDSQISKTSPFWERSVEGVKFGWEFIVTFIVGILHIWPFIMILIFSIIYWRFRKSRVS